MSDDIKTARLALGGGATVVPMPQAQVEQETTGLADEQLAYARVLDSGMKIGLLIVTVTFAVYLVGALTPHVPVQDLPKYWTMPVKKYLATAGIECGWAWLAMLGKGDFLNFVGIAFLAGVTLVCYLSIIPIFFRKKDLVYCWLAALEVIVLAVAASGLLKSGGH